MGARAVRVYVVYAEGDERFRDIVIAQARDSKLPAKFVYMPTKQPWVPRWKAACRERVLECHGAIVAIGRKTLAAESVGAELACIRDASIPLLGVYMEPFPGPAPEGLCDARLVGWDWREVADFICSLDGGLPLTAAS